MPLLRAPSNSWTCITRVPTAGGLVTVRLLTVKDLDQLRDHALSDECLGRHAIVRLCSRVPAAGPDQAEQASAAFANSLTPAEVDILANVVAALNAIRVEPGERHAVEVLGHAIADKVRRPALQAPPAPAIQGTPAEKALTRRLGRLTLRNGRH